MQDGKSNQGYMRTIRLKEAAANQYQEEANKEMPSVENSDVTITNNTEIVILRNKEFKILAHYQLLKDYKFFRLDKKIK
jgi:hypothetical protein